MYSYSENLNKKYICLLLVLYAQIQAVWANMGMPVLRKGEPNNAFVSRYVDVLHERIDIFPNARQKSVFFRVEYIIQSDTAGKQIPLLFLALDAEQFYGLHHTVLPMKIWLDNMPIKLQDSLPVGASEFLELYFKKDSITNKHLESKMRFFEVDLSKGKHTIRVEYDVSISYDRRHYLNEYLLNYSLAPAKEWRSFGTLEVSLHAPCYEFDYLRSNLEAGKVSQSDSLVVWRFNSLPTDVLSIQYKYKVPALAHLWAYYRWDTLTVLYLIFALLHFLWIYKIRNESFPKISERCLIGSILFLVVFSGIFYLGEWLHDILTVGRGVSESYHYGQVMMQNILISPAILLEYVVMFVFFLLRKAIVTP